MLKAPVTLTGFKLTPQQLHRKINKYQRELENKFSFLSLTEKQKRTWKESFCSLDP